MLDLLCLPSISVTFSLSLSTPFVMCVCVYNFYFQLLFLLFVSETAFCFHVKLVYWALQGRHLPLLPPAWMPGGHGLYLGVHGDTLSPCVVVNIFSGFKHFLIWILCVFSWDPESFKHFVLHRPSSWNLLARHLAHIISFTLLSSFLDTTLPPSLVHKRSCFVLGNYRRGLYPGLPETRPVTT